MKNQNLPHVCVQFQVRVLIGVGYDASHYDPTYLLKLFNLLAREGIADLSSSTINILASIRIKGDPIVTPTF